MAATQAMADASLTVPSHDDEMTFGNSPYFYPEEDDVEFDEDVNLTTEHNMVDDVGDLKEQNHTNDSTTPDEFMDEGVQTGTEIIVEETNDLEFADVEDEEHIQFDEQHHPEDQEIHEDSFDFLDDQVEQSNKETNAEPQENTEEQYEEEELFDEEDEEEEENDQHNTNTDDNQHQQVNEHPESTSNEADYEQTEEDVEYDDATVKYNEEEQDPEASDEDGSLAAIDIAIENNFHTDTEKVKDELTVDTTATARSPTGSLHSPTPLHPISVLYGGEEFPLFAAPDSKDPDEALLQDNSLATIPFDKFLTVCRETLGELGDDDEMVFEVPSLGLVISEDSKFAGKTTLVQIIDAYMLLSQNEQLAEIPPLPCRMHHRVCAETQLAYLVSSAREGRTYAEITEEHIDIPFLEQAETFETFNDEDAADHEAHEGLEIDDHDNVLESKVEQDNDHQHEHDSTEHQSGLRFDEDRIKTAEYGAETVADASEEVETAEAKEINNEILETRDEPNVDPEAAIDDFLADNFEFQTHDDQPAAEALETGNDHDENGTVPELDEDLFAEDDFTEDPATVTNPVDDDDQIDFDAWDAETEPPVTKVEPPVTPAKSINGKRKLEEEDDFPDLDFTPEPKRTKSS